MIFSSREVVITGHQLSALADAAALFKLEKICVSAQIREITDHAVPHIQTIEIRTRNIEQGDAGTKDR